MDHPRFNHQGMKVHTQVPLSGGDFRLDDHAPLNNIDDVFRVVVHQGIALAVRLEYFKFGGKEGRRRNPLRLDIPLSVSFWDYWADRIEKRGAILPLSDFHQERLVAASAMP